jgi:hypothetical protein
MADIIGHKTTWNEKGREIQAPVVLCCNCGEQVTCSDFTNTCECGQEYNFAGQALKQRDQWEEEY